MMKRLILLVFLALVIFSAIYALWDDKKFTTSSDQAYQAFMTAESYRKNLYNRDAVDEYEKAARIDSNFAIAYCRLAEMSNNFGQTDEAKKYIEKAESLFPLITKQEQLLISITKNTINRDFEARRKYVQEYIELFPDDIGSYRFQADNYVETKDYDKAIASFQKIIDKDPNDALAYNMLGYLNYWAGNYDEALTNIRKYALVGGKEANPHDSYGEILMYLGRYDEAIKEFETADKIKPDLDFVLEHLGVAHREIGKFRDAIGYFERAREFARNDIYAARVDEDIAYTYFLSGDKKQAVDILKPIFEEHPEWVSVSTMLGYFSADIGELDLARRCLTNLDSIFIADANRDSANVDTINSNYDLVEGKILQETADYVKSLQLYARVVADSRKPNTILIKSLYAQACIEAGEYELAKNLYLDNLEENHNHPLSLYGLARIYKHEGNTEKQKQALLSYLSVMSGADDGFYMVDTARKDLESLTVYSGLQ